MGKIREIILLALVVALAWFLFAKPAHDQKDSSEVIQQLDHLEEYERARAAGREALAHFVDQHPQSPHRESAESILAVYRRGD